MRRVEDGADLPRPGLCLPAFADEGGATLPDGLDDRTLAYIEDARLAFDQIRKINGQLAGLLVLAATGGRSAQDHPMFALILSGHDEMRDHLGKLRPTMAAEHHHRHLCRAARALSLAVTAARKVLHRRDETSLDAITEPLRRANQELHWATAALPGFAVVDLRQSCCANHAMLLPNKNQ